MKSGALVFISFYLLATSVQADTVAASPSCPRPDKPARFNTQSELDGYNDEVQQYQRCLYDFVNEQEKAIQNHQDAANRAIDEWNEFVKMELN